MSGLPGSAREQENPALLGREPAAPGAARPARPPSVRPALHLADERLCGAGAAGAMRAPSRVASKSRAEKETLPERSVRGRHGADAGKTAGKGT